MYYFLIRYLQHNKKRNKMKEQIIKAVSTLTPMSLVCWYVDEPRAAVAVFIIGFIATLERLEIKLNK